MSNLITLHLAPLSPVLENSPISKDEFIRRAKNYPQHDNLRQLIQMIQFNSAHKIGDEIILN